MPLLRILVALSFSLLLGACAGLPFGGERVAVHDLRVLARSTSPRLPSAIGIDTAEARRLVDIERRIEQAAGVRVEDFFLVDAGELNAFAAIRDGRRTLFINRAMVRALATDDAAVASLIGHEISHLALDHPSIKSGPQADLATGTRVLSTLAGTISTGAGAFVSVGGQLLTLAHSRQHEQEADAMGLDLAVRAGFEPTGALRVFALMPSSQSGGGGLFDSHPALGERVARLRQLIEQKYRLSEGGNGAAPAAAS